MKVFLVWERDEWDYEVVNVIKVFKEERKAKDFIENRDKMTGNSYWIEEKEVE